jgi:hypothetical protein
MHCLSHCVDESRDCPLNLAIQCFLLCMDMACSAPEHIHDYLLMACLYPGALMLLVPDMGCMAPEALQIWLPLMACP